MQQSQKNFDSEHPFIHHLNATITIYYTVLVYQISLYLTTHQCILFLTHFKVNYRDQFSLNTSACTQLEFEIYHLKTFEVKFTNNAVHTSEMNNS